LTEALKGRKKPKHSEAEEGEEVAYHSAEIIKSGVSAAASCPIASDL
jgi:hypothetical protein